MPHLFIRRTSETSSMSPTSWTNGDSPRDPDCARSSPSEYLLDDPDSDPLCRRSDPEAESVRSHPSSHADQALLPRAPTTAPARAQTQRLQRRRNQYYYSGGLLVPVPTTPSRPQHHAPPAPAAAGGNPHQIAHPSKRAKPYLASSGSGAPSWLLSSTGAFADAKRQSWTGERRESRKLQKDHPVGSARPSFTVEIPADDGGGGHEEASPGQASGSNTERDGGARGSVRRRMEKLRGLYKRGEKEAVGSSNLR